MNIVQKIPIIIVMRTVAGGGLFHKNLTPKKSAFMLKNCYARSGIKKRYSN